MRFLLRYTNLIIIAFLLAVFAGGYYRISILKQELATAEAQKAALKIELKVSQESVATLSQSIADQNAAIEKMKKEDASRFANNQAEVKKAKNKADNYRKQAEDLMKRRSPENTAKCTSAEGLINEEILNEK
jgi:predicted  nucleic acid-binding Zn-ribbon protein